MTWRAITGVSVAVLFGLLAFFVWLLGAVLAYLQPVLVPLAVAGIIAYLLDPVVSWLQRKGLTRLRAVLSVFGTVSILSFLLALIIVPPISAQVGEILSDREDLGSRFASTLAQWREVSWVKPGIDWALAEAPTDEDRPPMIRTDTSTHTSSTDDLGTGRPAGALKFSETNLGHLINDNAEKISATVLGWLSSGTSQVLALIGLMVGFVMVPIYLYYFLMESAAIKQNWHKYVPLRASRFKTELVDTLSEVNGYLISFFRGQMLVAMIDGVLVGMALWAFQLPYGLLIGLCMGVLGIIPFIGSIICLIPACIIAFVHFSAHPTFLGENPWAYVGAVLGIFVIVQQINSLVTAPKIVGESVGLHPMTVIFSMLFWSLLLGGFIGALLAVPLTAGLKVVFRRYIWERKMMTPPPIEDDADPLRSA